MQLSFVIAVKLKCEYMSNYAGLFVHQCNILKYLIYYY